MYILLFLLENVHTQWFNNKQKSLFLYLPVYALFFQLNKEILIDAVVHAVNEDYAEMANDFMRLGFLASGTDVTPIVPALEAIWQNSAGKGMADFNFRSVTGNLYVFTSHYCSRHSQNLHC